LALEIAAPLRPTNCTVGNSPADPRDEHRQPVVGSAENPWRASQARHRDRPDQRRQVYGAEEGPSLAGMEDVPSQPCGWHCRNGPLRRADNLVPAALWFADHGPWPAADPVVWGDRAPTAEWIANQLTEACGWEQIPRYLIRDRDRAYGEIFVRRVRSIGIRDRPTSSRSPWQNAYAERLIGSIRRECIDHVVVFGERHLRHVLLSYKDYYNATRTHLSLNKDAPVHRGVEWAGNVVRRPILGGLHHQYSRI